MAVPSKARRPKSSKVKGRVGRGEARQCRNVGGKLVCAPKRKSKLARKPGKPKGMGKKGRVRSRKSKVTPTAKVPTTTVAAATTTRRREPLLKHTVTKAGAKGSTSKVVRELGVDPGGVYLTEYDKRRRKNNKTNPEFIN